MRLTSCFALLIVSASLAACSDAHPAGANLTPDQQAAYDQAAGLLDGIKKTAQGSKDGQTAAFDRTAACAPFFEIKRGLIDVASDKLNTLWSDGDAVCLTPEQRFHVRRVSTALGYIATQTGHADFDPQYYCLAVTQARRSLAVSKDPSIIALLAKAEKTCGMDAWIPYASHHIDRAENAKRNATPGFSEACARAHIALDSIAPRFSSDPRVAPIRDKYRKVCASAQR